MEHIIKLKVQFANEILDGNKTFEIRKNDRGYQKGDTIKFLVIDDMQFVVEHELNNKEFEITYILNGWGLKEDYVVFSFREVQKLKDKTINKEIEEKIANEVAEIYEEVSNEIENRTSNNLKYKYKQAAGLLSSELAEYKYK